MEINLNIISKRKARSQEVNICGDCTMRPTKHIAKDGEWCRPHQGEVDNDLRPIDEHGRLYKPGLRSCGKSDCVRTDHVFNPEFERLDISYRTGKKFNLTRVLKEKV